MPGSTLAPEDGEAALVGGRSIGSDRRRKGGSSSRTFVIRPPAAAIGRPTGPVDDLAGLRVRRSLRLSFAPQAIWSGRSRKRQAATPIPTMMSTKTIAAVAMAAGPKRRGWGGLGACGRNPPSRGRTILPASSVFSRGLPCRGPCRNPRPASPSDRTEAAARLQATLGFRLHPKLCPAPCRRPPRSCEGGTGRSRMAGRTDGIPECRIRSGSHRSCGQWRSSGSQGGSIARWGRDDGRGHAGR